VIDGTGYDRWR
jgi:hypothetical protein